MRTSRDRRASAPRALHVGSLSSAAPAAAASPTPALPVDSLAGGATGASTTPRRSPRRRAHHTPRALLLLACVVLLYSLHEQPAAALEVDVLAPTAIHLDVSADGTIIEAAARLTDHLGRGLALQPVTFDVRCEAGCAGVVAVDARTTDRLGYASWSGQVPEGRVVVSVRFNGAPWYLPASVARSVAAVRGPPGLAVKAPALLVVVSGSAAAGRPTIDPPVADHTVADHTGTDNPILLVHAPGVPSSSISLTSSCGPVAPLSSSVTADSAPPGPDALAPDGAGTTGVGSAGTGTRPPDGGRPDPGNPDPDGHDAAGPVVRSAAATVSVATLSVATLSASGQQPTCTFSAELADDPRWSDARIDVVLPVYVDIAQTLAVRRRAGGWRSRPRVRVTGVARGVLGLQHRERGERGDSSPPSSGVVGAIVSVELIDPQGAVLASSVVATDSSGAWSADLEAPLRPLRRYRLVVTASTAPPWALASVTIDEQVHTVRGGVALRDVATTVVVVTLLAVVVVLTRRRRDRPREPAPATDVDRRAPPPPDSSPDTPGTWVHVRDSETGWPLPLATIGPLVATDGHATIDDTIAANGAAANEGKGATIGNAAANRNAEADRNPANGKKTGSRRDVAASRELAVDRDGWVWVPAAAPARWQVFCPGHVARQLDLPATDDVVARVALVPTRVLVRDAFRDLIRAAGVDPSGRAWGRATIEQLATAVADRAAWLEAPVAADPVEARELGGLLERHASGTPLSRREALRALQLLVQSAHFDTDEPDERLVALVLELRERVRQQVRP